jgi:hypothetical protein
VTQLDTALAYIKSDEAEISEASSLQHDILSPQIYRYWVAPKGHIVMKPCAELNQEFSLSSKFPLKKIDYSVFELSGFIQRNRQTAENSAMVCFYMEPNYFRHISKCCCFYNEC